MKKKGRIFEGVLLSGGGGRAFGNLRVLKWDSQMCGASTQDFVNFETCAAQRHKCDSIGKSIRASTDELPKSSI